MNRKLYGKRRVLITLLLLLTGLTMASCSKKIPGHPGMITKEYVDAIQRGDYKTIFALNVDSARNRKYLERTDMGDKEKILEENFDKNKSDYDTAEVSFVPGVRWAEKHFFPASASIGIGIPYSPLPAGEDDVNSQYEMDVTVFVPVIVKYSDKSKAPAYNGQKMKDARYDCSLRKLRESGTVRVYSHDDKWYIAGCLIEPSSITNHP